MRNRLMQPAKRLAKRLLFPIASHLVANQIHVDAAALATIEKTIRKNYHTGWRSESRYSEEIYAADLHAHLIGRLESDRNTVIPWLDHGITLKDRRILEIGCGTGASTIALVEQGAKVTGIDIDEGALTVAKDRTSAYGLNADFKVLNANRILQDLGTGSFDVVIYFASLEHMTIAERLDSLRQSWEMLPDGGLLIIVETPNRLWFFDSHTSRLPFFNWLPNELAFYYSRFSKRDRFSDLYRDYTPESKENFLRRGRGMSFHELELVIGRAEEFDVVSSLSSFQGIRHRLRMSRLERNFKSFLVEACPGIHEGFFEEFLYLIIQKNSKHASYSVT